MFGRDKKLDPLLVGQFFGEGLDFEFDLFNGYILWMSNPSDAKIVDGYAGTVPPTSSRPGLTALESARSIISGEFLRSEAILPADIFFDGPFFGFRVDSGQYLNGAFGLENNGAEAGEFGALFLAVVTNTKLRGKTNGTISASELAAVAMARYEKLHSL